MPQTRRNGPRLLLPTNRYKDRNAADRNPTPKKRQTGPNAFHHSQKPPTSIHNRTPGAEKHNDAPYPNTRDVRTNSTAENKGKGYDSKW